MTTSDSQASGVPSGQPRVCDGCFAEFDWTPTEHEGQFYCCQGCADGGPCACSYSGAPPEAIAAAGAEAQQSGAPAGPEGEAIAAAGAGAQQSGAPAGPEGEAIAAAGAEAQQSGAPAGPEGEAPEATTGPEPAAAQPPAEPPPPPPEQPRDEGGGDEEHECANCFTQFTWRPTVAGGDEYCCYGCADGGPCVCTYAGPPVPPPEYEVAGAEVAPQPAAEAAEPGEAALPPVPAPAAQGPSRHDVLLAAIAAFPVDLRAVATLRVTRDISINEIASELGMDVETAQRRLAQGRALLNRTLGPDYRLEYTPRPAERITVSRRQPPAVAVPSGIARAGGGWADIVSDSISILQQATGDDVPMETRSATLEEALGEAAEIFRLAARRLQQPEAERQDLRSMLAEQGARELHIRVTGLENPSDYLSALRRLDAVENVQIESVEGGAITYQVNSSSQRDLITGLVGMQGFFRPRSLRVAGDRIEIGIGDGSPSVAAMPPPAPTPERAPVAAIPEAVEPVVYEAPPRPRGAGIPTFELGADAFFGARHFLTFGGRQGETHYHSWRVEVIIESDANDEEGTVLGFAEARGALEAKVAEYNETLLNNVEPYDRIQPTAENIARVIYQGIAPSLARGSTRLRTVRVWESPTNHAAYSVA